MDAMLRSMTAAQFAEWRAFASLEPFDERRADYRTASIVSAVWNAGVMVASRGRRKGSVTMKNALITFGEAENAPQTPEQAREQIKQTMMLLMQIHNAPRH